MPRSGGIVVDNSFVKGLVTEATGLSFPEDACTETYDCIFKKTGEVTRRKGFEYEPSYSLFTLTASRNDSAVSSFRWTGAGGDGNSSFVVTQVGRYIYFYAVNDSLSSAKHATSIDLNTFAVAGILNPFEKPVSFAQGDGKLFVVGQHIEPFYVMYTPSTDTLTAGAQTQITIEVRDTEGDEQDTYGIDQRPAETLTTDTAAVNAHLYNLMNQGWAEKVLTDGTPARENPVKYWDAGGDLPSSSDRWWQLKNTTDKMDNAQKDVFPLTSSEVPKGHFIFNAFDVDRSTVTGSDESASDRSFDDLWGRGGLTNKASTLSTKSTNFRPSSVAFYASRVWYAGVNDTDYNTTIYFSRLLTEDEHIGQCYQEQDPTSEDFYEALPTDGGFITIPEIGNIVSMFEAQNSLIVFATNGIWKIQGSEGIGFTATDYSVNKISSVQNVDNQSFVLLNGVPAWINNEGVWLLQQDQTLGSVNVTSLSKDTIQSFFEDIPSSSLPYIQGTYNPRERLVYWLYRSTEAVNLDGQYEYDRCLVFNTETGAFYPWKLNTDSGVKVLSVITSVGFSTITEEADVVVGADDVIDSSIVNVTADVLTSVSVSGTMKLLVEDNANRITWAEQYDTSYLDWTTAKGTGKNYSSYFISGYRVRGEAIRGINTTYVRVHSRVQDNSSVRIQGVWDYYTSDGARWSSPQQGYKTKVNGQYSDRRLKIRGYGLALQLRFASEQGKPFNVIGWSSMDTVAAQP